MSSIQAANNVGAMKKRNIIFALSMVVMFGFRLLPTGGSLTAEGLSILGIFFGSLIMWMFISIDWPCFITLLAMCFLPSGGGFGAIIKNAFGNVTVAFLIFTFIVMYPLAKTSFIRRCTVAFTTNRVARKSPWHFIAVLFAAFTFMGLFMSPTALIMAFLPFLEDVCRIFDIKKGSPVANVMMLGVVCCINLSSGMTPIAHVWPVMAMGYYTTATGNVINQFQFMAMAVPTGLIIIALMFLALRFLYNPKDVDQIDPEKAMALRGTVPKADRQEKIILSAIGLTVFLWVVPSLVKDIFPSFYSIVNGWGTCMPPLLGSAILFVLTDKGEQIVKFHDAATKGVLWTPVIVAAITLQLGALMDSDAAGISASLTELLGPFANRLPTYGFVAFIVMWAVIQTNFSSNIVTVTVVSSIVMAIMAALPEGAVNMAVVISLVGLGASVANMTPSGMAGVNSVAIGSEWTNPRSMFIWGGVFAVIAIICMVFIGYPLGCLFM